MSHFPALAACWDGVGLLPFSALIYDWKRRMRTPPNPKAKVFQIYYYYFPFFPLYHPHLSSHSFILLIYPFHTRIANKDSSPFHAAHLLIQRVPSPSTLLIFYFSTLKFGNSPSHLTLFLLHPFHHSKFFHFFTSM